MLIQCDRDVALLDVGEVWASEVPSGDKIPVVLTICLGYRC